MSSVETSFRFDRFSAGELVILHEGLASVLRRENVARVKRWDDDTVGVLMVEVAKKLSEIISLVSGEMLYSIIPPLDWAEVYHTEETVRSVDITAHGVCDALASAFRFSLETEGFFGKARYADALIKVVENIPNSPSWWFRDDGDILDELWLKVEEEARVVLAGRTAWR